MLEISKGNAVMNLSKLFTDHPASVDETYFGHMAFAAWFSSRLFIAGGAALVHAFLPFLCETTASRIVRELYERTSNRKPHHAGPAEKIAA
jgi:hypothetical protein